MTVSEPVTPTTDPVRVATIAQEISSAKLCALDLEFVSEGRYVPDLALIQLAWGDPDAPQVAAVDPLAVDPAPIFDLVRAPDVEVVAHAGRQDLALLATLGVQAQNIWDTQIAAAFVGRGEQIGYARLVDQLFGIHIDKGSQFTNWCKRPLSAKQLRYAIDDVRHLFRAWPVLRDELVERGRLGWVREECVKLMEVAGERTPPDQVYRGLGGWRGLKGPAQSRLRGLAAWREREALATNTPPSWILPDAAVLELSKRGVKEARDLKKIRGIGPGIMRKYGDAVMQVLAQQSEVEPPASEPLRGSLAPRAQAWASIVASLITARCATAELPARFVGSRGDADELVRAFEQGQVEQSSLSLLEGWRREFIGEQLLQWLRGEIAIAVSPDAAGGLRTMKC